MSTCDDAKLWGNSGMIGLTTSLATDDPTLNAIAGCADVGVNLIANPIAVNEAVKAVEGHLGVATLGRNVWDFNHYGTLTSVNRSLSAEEIAALQLRTTEAEKFLSNIGTSGSCIDAAINFKTGLNPSK